MASPASDSATTPPSISGGLRELGRGLHALVAHAVGRPWFWAAFVLVGVTLPIVRTLQIELPAPLPVLAQVPEFRLTDQHGQPYGSKELHGRVWVANFIFTRCPTICPRFTAKMGQIQHRARGLGEHFHLVSFTVDPEHDTPERLADYAKKSRSSPRMWSFLTGSREALRSTIVDGLKVHMTNDGPTDDLMSIGHGSHFVLVDQEMRVRGYYDSSDEAAVDALLRDAGLLANRGE